MLGTELVSSLSLKMRKAHLFPSLARIFSVLLHALTSAFICCEARSEPLKVGVIAPLTGIVADYGAAIKNGMTMAQEEVPAAERGAVEFIYEDAQYNSKLSIAAFNKLALIDRANLIYSFGTSGSSAIAPIAEQLRVPTIILSGEPALIAHRRYVIDFHNRLEDLAVATLVHVRSRGFKNFGVVKTEVPYMESLVKAFQKHLAQDESITIIDSFPPDENTMLNSTALKIKRGLERKQFDAIGIFLLTGQIGTLFQRMTTYGISAPTFGSDVFGQVDEMRKAGPAARGGVFAIFQATKSFSDRYYERFGDRLQLHYAANSYDLAKLIYNQLAHGDGSRSADAIMSRLQNVKVHDGALGTFRYVDEADLRMENPGRRFVFPVVMKEIVENGESELLPP